LYPLCVYLYVKLLFYVWLETTEWFFMALMTMVIILLGSVFALARVGERRMPWATVVGAIAYPILDYSIYHLAYSLMHLPTAGPGEAITPNAFLAYELTWTGVQAFFGALFGLLLGLILGYQKKNNSPQITAKL
jgi:ABC-type phosphate/phosphonate transport system permease subunit